jgi:hypothetical protein
MEKIIENIPGKLIAPADLAMRWKCSKRTIAKIRRNGLLPYVSLNKRLFRFRLDDIEDIEKASKTPGTTNLQKLRMKDRSHA